MPFANRERQPADAAKAPALPTLLIALLIYAGWALATLEAAHIPPLALAAIGGWLLAWHGSLQHETIHGHPTPWPWLNRLIGLAPLSLWLPYDRYRDLHTRHHAAEHLTAPGVDTESRYLPATSGPIARGLARLTSTLAGRLTLGPVVEILGFLTSEARAFANNQAGVRKAWLVHLLLAGAVVAWLLGPCHMSLIRYAALFVYPGCALSLIRSFAEHRADGDPLGRIAIVEQAPLLGLLFLNNNLHAAHHAFPEASWRELPGLYAARRDQLLTRNDGLVYQGYGEVFRRYLFRAHDQIVHPAQGRAPT